MTTTDDYISNVVNGPVYDHCPPWCRAGNGERMRNQLDDGHPSFHETSCYVPSGSRRVYASMQRADLHGMPSMLNSEPDIMLSNGKDDEGRIEFLFPVSAARSLARILTHLADLEEL